MRCAYNSMCYNPYSKISYRWAVICPPSKYCWIKLVTRCQHMRMRMKVSLQKPKNKYACRKNFLVNVEGTVDKILTTEYVQHVLQSEL